MVLAACLTASTLLSLHASQPADTGRTRLFRYLMGTSVRVEVYGGASDAARTEAAEEAFGAVREVDRVMSDYRQDSELAQLNARGASQPVVVSGPLFAVVAAAGRVERASHGAFSAVVTGPDASRSVILNAADHSIRFAHAGVRLSLDGLAKGFAAELAAGSLRRRGLSGAVDIGGVQFMTGLPAGKPVWSIGLADPTRRGALLGALDVHAGAVATATPAAVQARPAIAPEPGRPLSVTVVSSDGTLADALSRAAVRLPSAEALRLLSQFPDTWGVVGLRTMGGGLDTVVSPGHASDFHPSATR